MLKKICNLLSLLYSTIVITIVIIMVNSHSLQRRGQPFFKVHKQPRFHFTRSCYDCQDEEKMSALNREHAKLFVALINILHNALPLVYTSANHRRIHSYAKRTSF